MTKEEKKALYQTMTWAPRVVGYWFSGIGLFFFLLFGLIVFFNPEKPHDLSVVFVIPALLIGFSLLLYLIGRRRANAVLEQPLKEGSGTILKSDGVKTRVLAVLTEYYSYFRPLPVKSKRAASIVIN